MKTRLISQLDSIYDACLALVYPQACAACGASVEERAYAPACGACWARTEIYATDATMCWKCGMHGRQPVVEVERTAIHCRRCDTEPWAAARSVGVYGGALRAAVLDLKRHPRIGEKAIELMYEWLRCAPLESATLVIPVPLHKERARERGFNQAAIIAERLARRARLPFDDASLARVKYAATHRAGMDAEARRESVADSFAVTRPRLIAGESVLLVDDVWTTGATASACAAPLLAAGAREVFVLTLARAKLHMV